MQNDYDYTTNINMIQFKGNLPFNVISDMPYPLGKPSIFCSFCCSDYNITITYLNNDYGITHCYTEECMKLAHISLGYAYSTESPLLFVEPINSHKINSYDNITNGYITYIYIKYDNFNVPQLYAHLEYKTKFYHTHEDILFSELLTIPENTKINFIDIMTFNCSKYGYYSLEQYNMYKYLLTQLNNNMNDISLTIQMNTLEI